MDTVRIGVIGVGHLGSLHVRMLSDMPGVLLAGVFDSDGAKADAVAMQYKTVRAASMQALFDSSDAVTIATNTGAHFPVASQALDRGKHIFLENRSLNARRGRCALPVRSRAGINHPGWTH